MLKRHMVKMYVYVFEPAHVCVVVPSCIYVCACDRVCVFAYTDLEFHIYTYKSHACMQTGTNSIFPASLRQCQSYQAHLELREVNDNWKIEAVAGLLMRSFGFTSFNRPR